MISPTPIETLHARILKPTPEGMATFEKDVRETIIPANAVELLSTNSGYYKDGPQLAHLIAAYDDAGMKGNLLSHFLDMYRGLATLETRQSLETVPHIMARGSLNRYLNGVMYRCFKLSACLPQDIRGYTALMNLAKNTTTPDEAYEALSVGLLMHPKSVNAQSSPHAGSDTIGTLLAIHAPARHISSLTRMLLDSGLKASHTTSADHTAMPNKTMADILSMRSDAEQLAEPISKLRAQETLERKAEAQLVQTPWWKRAAQACVRIMKICNPFSKMDHVDDMRAAIRADNPVAVRRAAMHLPLTVVSIAAEFAENAKYGEAAHTLFALKKDREKRLGLNGPQ